MTNQPCGVGTRVRKTARAGVVTTPRQVDTRLDRRNYRNFLQFLIDTGSAGWFSYVIVFGELAVGIGLILGAFVGLAAAGGLLMNLAFMLAGTTSTNPVLAILGVLLILAWKNAGYVGLDRYLLPLLGTPWKQTKPVRTTVMPAPVPTTS